MRSIASSIVILSSCILFAAAGFVTHSDTNLFLNGVAVFVGIIGLIGWFTSSGESGAKK
ncbi:hypothetical protein Mal15_21600 [Stieleria maiorica]|uniref:Photosystem II reaction center protein Z n=1 Tax=Stieleria maiorica TaxID=2795974 RepID=A0A5B9MBJ4_9BACT|nr:hypothetical protein [Stieleria maiorica]QEF98113.1 hypothetical protein Mal15_21600 [Stieleria maiorica]